MDRFLKKLDKPLWGLFCLLCLFFSACNSTPALRPTPTSIITETQTVTATFIPSPIDTLTQVPTTTPTPLPTNTTTPIQRPTMLPSETPANSTEPGLIATLGEGHSGPWDHVAPVFSPDGQTIALASGRIRFWVTAQVAKLDKMKQ